MRDYFNWLAVEMSKPGYFDPGDKLYKHYKIALKYYRFAGVGICALWILKALYYKVRSLVKV